jgi:Ca2+:H+ antiporter
VSSVSFGGNTKLSVAIFFNRAAMDASIRDTSGTYQPWVDTASEKVAENENVKDRLEKILFTDTIRPMALTGPLNILLICVPIAIISYAASWPSSVTFIFSLLALAPLAERLGYVTESLALHTNDTIGGLLNATFGNATELIVAITAMKRGLFRLVQLSLLGSILSNMLLVLGCSFLAGGYYHKTQTFGTISSQMNSTLLMIATMGITFPAILSGTSEESNLGELGYSRGTSLVLFLLYFAFLYFQVLQYHGLCPI